jgi:putative ABC transport system ATP-binding protein
MTPTLVLSGVTKRYRSGRSQVHALRGVDLVVHRGEMVAVMGPSGSGKSTLLHLAAGLELPTMGEVVLEGSRMPRRIEDRVWAAARRDRIGFVFQRFNLLPSFTVLENVALPLELAGTARRRAAAAASAALSACGLDGRDGAFPDDLSGGEQQRVAIARAVVAERSLLLADEPTGALDTAAGDDVVALLAERAGAGAAVLLATHDSRIASWADRVVFLHDGRVVDETAAAPLEAEVTLR